MNLEEASRHPDRLAKEAADAAFSSLHHIHEIVARQYSGSNKLNDDQKLHVVSALEEACKAYKAAKAVESVIVNSDFFPDDADAIRGRQLANEEACTLKSRLSDIAGAAAGAKALCADDGDGVPLTPPPEPDEPYMEEDEGFVRSYVLAHGHIYKFPVEDRVAMKFVDSVDFVRNRFGGEKNVWHVFGLETGYGENSHIVYALLSVEPSILPGSDFIRKPLSEFSDDERASIINTMKLGSAGLFSEEKLGADSPSTARGN